MNLEKILANTLTRYRHYDDMTINAFKEDKVFFSIPKNYNDPFDALMYVEHRSLLSFIYRCIEENMEGYLSEKDIQDPLIKMMAQDFKLNSKSRRMERFLNDIDNCTKTVEKNFVKIPKLYVFQKTMIQC